MTEYYFAVKPSYIDKSLGFVEKAPEGIYKLIGRFHNILIDMSHDFNKKYGRFEAYVTTDRFFKYVDLSQIFTSENVIEEFVRIIDLSTFIGTYSLLYDDAFHITSLLNPDVSDEYFITIRYHNGSHDVIVEISLDKDLTNIKTICSSYSHHRRQKIPELSTIDDLRKFDTLREFDEFIRKYGKFRGKKRRK